MPKTASAGCCPRCSFPGVLVILHYRCNFSAFSGYRRTPSNYSSLLCCHCGNRFRTKAKYVNSLKILTNKQLEYVMRGVPPYDWHELMRIKD